FRTGSAPSVSIPTSAWPPSWYAVRRLSSWLIITCRSAPSTMRSSASVKSASMTASWLRRAASSAASVTRFARSAPTIPRVVAAEARDAGCARASDRVELVDEDDRGRGLLRLREQVTDTRSADADDRLHEL